MDSLQEQDPAFTMARANVPSSSLEKTEVHLNLPLLSPVPSLPFFSILLPTQVYTCGYVKLQPKESGFDDRSGL